MSAQNGGSVESDEKRRKELRDALIELERQAKKTKLELEAVEKRVREKRSEVIVANIDALIALNPEHNPGACTDDNMSSIWDKKKCIRCCLLGIKRDQYFDSGFEVVVMVSILSPAPKDVK